jgi:hypothetical protein
VKYQGFTSFSTYQALVVQQAKPLFSTDSHFEVTISISAKVTSE